MPKGKVKWYNPKKGFGFVAPEDGGDEAFLHQSVIAKGDQFSSGDTVEFKVEEGKKGPRVTSIKVIERAGPTPPPEPEKEKEGVKKPRPPRPRPRLVVSVGYHRPEGWQDVTLQTFDEEENPQAGHVKIPAYDPQVMEVQGIETPAGGQPFIPTPNGVGQAAIKLLPSAGQFLNLTFVHQESRESSVRLFKK